ncbi:MAG: prohibitin family protein [Ruminococcaceae bacterium]|nr:prohibitin family protein [Oscillospiraceae bacterium]
MVGLVVGLIALLVGIVGGFAVRSNYKLKKFSSLFMIAGVLLCVVSVFLSCVASVPTGHTGVITTFGRVEKTTFDAGFNIKAPWQSVVKMDNRVQKANTLLSCFSSDIQEVTVSYTLNYQIDKSNAQELYKTVGIAYYDTVIVPNIAEAVKVVTARYTAEELVSARADLAAAIEDVLKENLSKYNIQVVSAAIEDMDFTDAFTNAVEAKQVAAQNKLQAEIEQAQKVMEQKAAAEMAVIQANAAAETSKIQAQAELEVTKIQSDAAEYAGQKEAAANEAIAKSLTEYLIKYYYIQEWDGKLPETYVGSDDVSTIINGITSSK